jgi:hypothetical protein
MLNLPNTPWMTHRWRNVGVVLIRQPEEKTLYYPVLSWRNIPYYLKRVMLNWMKSTEVEVFL